MPDESPTSIGTLRARIRELLGLPGEKGGAEFVVPTLEQLLGQTRRQLIEGARQLGLTGIHRVTKDVLAARFQAVLGKLVHEAEGKGAEAADHSHKFDLGYAPAPPPVDSGDIPWGYGHDRVTAMAVDADRLFVYWEVTDDAIARARDGLGPGGAGAVLALRVYDVTARIFDGTNAHAYFDHTVARTDRQWFFSIGKPTSTVVVELGLESDEGYFVRVARSGRVDFPRREPVGQGGVEWLTVRTATGEPGEPTPEMHAAPPPPAEAGLPSDVEPRRAWDIRRMHEDAGGGWTLRDEWRGEWVRAREWLEERVLEWEGPAVRMSWEEGPFAFAVEPPEYGEKRHDGPVTVTSAGGRTHVVQGPWRVVIRGLGSHAERRVLGVWEIRRSWVTSAGVATHGGAYAVREQGGSEELVGGASERRWLAGSEMRLGGASELYRVGASELRYLGASETAFAAASEWRLGGASEWRYAGASEERLAGASEQRHVGASEARFAGASERVLGYPELSDSSDATTPEAG
jgi:uncharacterized protein